MAVPKALVTSWLAMANSFSCLLWSAAVKRRSNRPAPGVGWLGWVPLHQQGIHAHGALCKAAVQMPMQQPPLLEHPPSSASSSCSRATDSEAWPSYSTAKPPMRRPAQWSSSRNSGLTGWAVGRLVQGSELQPRCKSPPLLAASSTIMRPTPAAEVASWQVHSSPAGGRRTPGLQRRPGVGMHACMPVGSTAPTVTRLPRPPCCSAKMHSRTAPAAVARIQGQLSCG